MAANSLPWLTRSQPAASYSIDSWNVDNLLRQPKTSRVHNLAYLLLLPETTPPANEALAPL
ncbi:hypothetical protein DAPPUDRAFT_236946 [Daphnia pulex]|uniref:Uncharacterized protein n=1 Tax=Daphnia pulex TaxID=6669 RepID=E9G2C5_DAPPU|nr:hypothetical protein DAPPUDRAFT_236946 [Daphnia pulex]|eukprot:EFX86225.1 hypothetical protein DAPPUDRAFT_236946 [Daphnia pulex]